MRLLGVHFGQHKWTRGQFGRTFCIVPFGNALKKDTARENGIRTWSRRAALSSSIAAKFSGHLQRNDAKTYANHSSCIRLRLGVFPAT
jgi:hypothetical protein